MAKRVMSSTAVRETLKNSFHTQYESGEDTVKRGFGRKKEFTPLKTESHFKPKKLEDKLRFKQYDKMDARDMLLYFKKNVEAVGNKCPIAVNGTQHNLMKTLIQKYGSYTVYTVIRFLFEAEQNFIHKRVISLHYINKNIDWLQAYGDMFERGEDYTELMQMSKPVSSKSYVQNITGSVRESDFSGGVMSGW